MPSHRKSAALRRLAATIVVASALLAQLSAAPVRAQAGPPTKDAPTHPCAFDPGAGRSVRCATAGQSVTWSVSVQNPRNSAEVFEIRDPAPVPGGCFTFTCDPILLVNAMPVPLPPGTTCDPATGFVIPGIDVPPLGFVEARIGGTLAPGLSAGETCENVATIVYPWASVTTTEVAAACQVDRGGGVFPTILTICGGSGGPSFSVVKTAETPAGAPLSAVADGDPICWRFRIDNGGTTPGLLNLADTFDPPLDALAEDPLDRFATGTCSVAGSTYACGNIILDVGGSDEARVCGTFACRAGDTQACNVAVLTILDPPPGGTVFSQPCPTCPVGATCLDVLLPDFGASTKDVASIDVNRSGCFDTGDTVGYDVQVINAGTATAPDTLFMDRDPPEGTYANDCTWSVLGGPFVPCPAPPATGFSLGALDPGGRPILIRWTVNITSDLPSPQWCDEAGLLTSGCVTAALSSSCLPTCAPGGPDVQGVVACDPAAVFAGEEVALTIHACNEGTEPASSVVLTHPIQACSAYVPGTLELGLDPAPLTALTDAADGDGATLTLAPDSVAFDLQAFLRRRLAPGECVTAKLRVVAATCAASGFIDGATITGDGMGQRPASSCFVQVLQPQPDLFLRKLADPDPVVGPGDLVTYTLRACNDADATGDATNVVVGDDVPACTTYEPGSLRVDGRRLTDVADGDEGELVAGAPGDATRFRAARIAPGECVDFSWQARTGASCGGTLVRNTATFGSDEVAGPLSSNETVTAVSTYTLQKSATDVDSGRLVAGDELEYAIEFCNGSALDLLQVDVTDLVPTLTGTPASDCPVTYVPESMTVQVDGGPVMPLTDRTLDDLAHFEPGPPAFIEVIVSPQGGGECFVVRFRVRLDFACAPGECVRNAAHAQFTTPLQEIDSNVATACVGSQLGGELFRGVGIGSLVSTGGCERGPRLLEFACSELPGLCRVDVPGTRWTLLRDAEIPGETLVFYELPGNACCIAFPSDDATLHVWKPLGATDVVVEIVPGCN